MYSRSERIADTELKSIFESEDFVSMYALLTGGSLSHSSLKKMTLSVFDKDTKNTNLKDEQEKLRKLAFTCGTKVVGFGTKSIYTIATFLQIEYFQKLRDKTGNAETIKKIMIKKKKKLEPIYNEYKRMLNDSQFDELKDYNVTYSTIELMVRGILEIPIALPSFTDTIYPSQKDQELLAVTLDKTIMMYKNDLDYMAGWLEYKDFQIMDYSLFSKLNELLEAYKENIMLLKNHIFGDIEYEKVFMEKSEEKLLVSLQALHENNEFPTLVAELLKRRGYYDIYMTKDTRDNGVDIFATKKETLNQLELKIAFSLKRYRSGNQVSRNHIIEIVEAVKKHNVNKGVVITSSSFDSGAIGLAKENEIEIINGKQLIKELVNLKVGFLHGYIKDNNFWTLLSTKKASYSVPILKYIK